GVLDSALGNGDTGASWHGHRGGHDWDDFRGNACIGQSLNFFKTAAENKRISTLEARNSLSHARVEKQQLINAFLPHSYLISDLGHVNNFFIVHIAELVQFWRRTQMIRENHISVLQGMHAAHSE